MSDAKLLGMTGAFMFFVGWMAHMNYQHSAIAAGVVACGGALILLSAMYDMGLGRRVRRAMRRWRA